MKFGIIVDSGCDLRLLSCTTKHQISFQRVPLKLRIGEKEFVDDFSLDINEYMTELREYPGKTGSAAPSPEEWYRAYQTADEIFAITITGALSGSFNSAMMGKKLLEEDEPGKKIHLIDSKSAGPELTLIAQKITEYIQQDMTFEQIVEAVENYRKKTHLLFVLESLDNLVKNGRASRFQGAMAGLLGIKILGCASKEGVLEILKKCRGKLGAYENLISEMISRGYHGGKAVISHCYNTEKAEYLAAELKKRFKNCIVEIMPTSGLCSFYAQEHGILVSFET